ncbi:MAG: c-type cytochrome [Burkholderiales bacterium]|nr:c-type cytochrome [Burkholderiales bacterium]
MLRRAGLAPAFSLGLFVLVSGCSRGLEPADNAAPEIALAAKSQCLACHALDHKVIGPAWNDVSKRYNGRIRAGTMSEQEAEESLVKKISMGGKGNWIDVTGGMSMPPSYPRVSGENIRRIVRYILSLKTQN